MSRRNVEVVTAVLAGVTAVNAFGGAVYGWSGAPDVPRDWLEGSPFSDYRVPSLALGVGVGGTSAAAAACAWRGSDRAALSASVAGGGLVVWIAAQVSVIGLRSTLQPIMAGVGVSLVALGRRLR